MLPFVRLGPLLIQLPGLALLAGIWIGSLLVEKEAGRLRLNPSIVLNLVIYGLAGGLLGARALYVLEHLNAYAASPLSALALSSEALDGWGGLLIGLAIAYLHGRAKGLRLRHTLDALAPGLAVFMIALGVADLLSGEGYGLYLDAPWAVYLWGAYRHPTQIYETLLSAGVLMAWRFLPPASSAPGSRFWQVISLAAGARLFTQAFHAESAVILGGFRLVQLGALALLAAAMFLGRRWASAASPARRVPSARSRAAGQTTSSHSKRG